MSDKQSCEVLLKKQVTRRTISKVCRGPPNKLQTNASHMGVCAQASPVLLPVCSTTPVGYRYRISCACASFQNRCCYKEISSIRFPPLCTRHDIHDDRGTCNQNPPRLGLRNLSNGNGRKHKLHTVHTTRTRPSWSRGGKYAVQSLDQICITFHHS